MVTRIVAAQVAAQASQQARTAARKVGRTAQRAATGMLGLAGERMSKVDTAWLRMDSDSNLMMIVGVWTVKPGISYDALCQRVEDRLLKYPRFRQRVMEDAAGATWVDQKVNVRDHVVRDKLPKHRKGESQAALQKLVGDLAMVPLDRKRPLWDLHFIEDYEGGSAIVVRIHHCIADGIALISVTMSLVDGGNPPPERKRKAAPAGAEDWIADTLIKPLTDVTVKMLDAAGDGAAKGLGMLRDPQKGMSGSLDMARLAYQVVSDAASLALMPDDSKTRLKGKPGNAKREYLRTQGDDVTGQEIRAMIPVNLRPLDQAYKLGNRFGLVPLVLPIGMDNPIERVYEVRRRMTALKGSTQPLLAFGLLAVAGLLIKPAQDAMLNLFGRKTTAVMTNVPGPREKLKFLGSTLEQSMFWVPQSGDIGLGVSILSYGGGVQFGVITDTKLCPDPQKIIDEFEPEFAKLSLVTLMLPWGEAQ
jgi:diacylglycerol O-acyltransferase / wax synthase